MANERPSRRCRGPVFAASLGSGAVCRVISARLFDVYHPAELRASVRDHQLMTVPRPDRLAQSPGEGWFRMTPSRKRVSVVQVLLQLPDDT